MTHKHNPQFTELAKRVGLMFPGAMDFMPANAAYDFRGACDAQPALQTVTSGGIPFYLLNFMDPEVVRVLLSPMNAAVICGEAQKGSWITAEATFPIVESTGEVSSYGDYSENGSAGANTNFNTRQSYHYQTITKWGEKELEIMGEAKINWVNEQNMASALTLKKFQNKTYFFGVSGIKCYGLLNDPALPASLSPTVAWGSATAEQIYEDVRRIFKQLQLQLGGLIDQKTQLVLSMSPQKQTDLNKTNQFNVNVFTLIKGNFPNVRFETAPEYALAAGGELVQMMVESLDGVKTATCAFTELMRAHPIITGESSWRQKKSQGTWGTVIKRPAAIASMLAV